MSVITELPSTIDWQVARRRWGDPVFAAARNAIEQRSRAAADHRLMPVTEAAGWGHAFFCPEHVVALEFEPERPSAHRCPVDGHRWQGTDFDAGWVCTLNSRIQSGVQAAAIEWRLTGDSDLLDYVRAVLTRYAEIYRGLPLTGRWVGKGKVTAQSLEEAVWAIGIVTTIDRIRDTLSHPEQSTIRTGLLEPLADHLQSQLLDRVHNIECWHLAGLAAVGVALDDADLIAAAVDGPTGLHAQFDTGIADDGWWVEGSPHYHFYMATAMLHSVQLLHTHRPDLTDRDDLRRMLLTPLTMIRPDLSLPALNDGWHNISEPHGIGQFAGHYEIAYGIWGDDAFGQVIAALQRAGVERRSDAALLYGPEAAASAADDAPSSAPLRLPMAVRNVHPASGYAVLRDPDPDGRVLLLKYGPHGGGHGHPDKLQLDWYAHGERLAPDAGSPAYTSPLQGPWFRQTLSHNTIVIAGQSQPPGCGRLLGYQDPSTHQGIGLSDAQVKWDRDVTPHWGGSWLKEARDPDAGPYAGVSLRRTVLWHPDYLIDLVQVDGLADPATAELLWHHRGRRVAGAELITTTEEFGEATPYEFLTDLTRHRSPSPHWSATWESNGVHTRLWAHDPADATVLEARSPTSPPAESRCTVLRRTTGTSMSFVSVLETWADTSPVVTGMSTAGEVADGTLSVSVQHEDRTDQWSFGTTDEESRVAIVAHEPDVVSYQALLATS